MSNPLRLVWVRGPILSYAATGALLVATCLATACGGAEPDADRAQASSRPSEPVSMDDFKDLQPNSGRASKGNDLGPADMPLEGLGLTPEADLDGDVRGLIGAERRFAGDAARDGVRSAFLYWLAEGATCFTPEPTAARPFYTAIPPDTQPSLSWAPLRVEVAASGDLGFSTGPYQARAAGSEEVSTGHFVSIWRKDDEGRWRVVCDTGVVLEPGAWPESAYGSRGKKAPGEPPESAAQERSVMEGLESGLVEASQEVGRGPALLARVSENVQVLHEGTRARAGRAWIERDAALDDQPHTTHVHGAVLASTRDLGAAWGVMEQGAGTRQAFLRVWRREGNAWRVALDARSSLPSETDDD